MAEFKSNVDELIDTIKNSHKANGFEEIFLPGEIELRKKQELLKGGIPVPGIILDELKCEGEACGIPYTLE